MTSPSPRTDDDRGRIRVILAVPIVLLTFIAGYFCWTAWTIRPSGAWDHDAYRGIMVSCLIAVGIGGSAASLWLVPSVRRVMPWGWGLPALLLMVAAGVRWAVGG